MLALNYHSNKAQVLCTWCHCTGEMLALNYHSSKSQVLYLMSLYRWTDIIAELHFRNDKTGVKHDVTVQTYITSNQLYWEQILLSFCFVTLERRSAWLVVGTQVKACSRETHRPSRASKTYGHDAFKILHIHTTVINSGRTHTTQHRTPHTLRALTVASILADAAVTIPSPKWPKM